MLRPWPNVIKLFTAVIYRHSMVIPSFCVIKHHYLGNYCRMVVNYHRNIYNIIYPGMTVNSCNMTENYHSILTLEIIAF